MLFEQQLRWIFNVTVSLGLGAASPFCIKIKLMNDEENSELSKMEKDIGQEDGVICLNAWNEKGRNEKCMKLHIR